MSRSFALVGAAGLGERFAQRFPKQFAAISGRSVLELCAHGMTESGAFNHTIVAVPAEYVEKVRHLLKETPGFSSIEVITGGRERHDTLEKMIATADEKWNLEPSDVLSLVDANRPLTSPEVYRESVALARKFGVACPFVKLADGVARVDASGAITRILDRGGLTRIATPESFTWESFLALPDEVVGNLGLLGIAEMFVAAGKNVQTFQSNEFSLKLTHPEDWELFLRLVRYRLEDVGQPKLLEFLADEPGPEATLNSSGVPS